jgi:hypothetical protein
MIQASQIREHMQVVGSDGQRLGTVDRVDGSSRIRLAPQGGAGGGENIIPLDWVSSVEDQTIRLSRPSQDVRRELEKGGAARKA